jgi:hypothetical protein
MGRVVGDGCTHRFRLPVFPDELKVVLSFSPFLSAVSRYFAGLLGVSHTAIDADHRLIEAISIEVENWNCGPIRHQNIISDGAKCRYQIGAHRRLARVVNLV